MVDICYDMVGLVLRHRVTSWSLLHCHVWDFCCLSDLWLPYSGFPSCRAQWIQEPHSTVAIYCTTTTVSPIHAVKPAGSQFTLVYELSAYCNLRLNCHIQQQGLHLHSFKGLNFTQLADLNSCCFAIPFGCLALRSLYDLWLNPLGWNPSILFRSFVFLH